MLRIFIHSLLFSILLPTAWSGTARNVSLNLCCLRHAGDLRSLLLKSDPTSAPAEVPFYQGGFTEPVPALVENGRIVVYKKGSGEEPPWVPDWSFAVPGSDDEVTVILLPNSPEKGSGAPYSAFLLPATKDFDYGSLLAVNLTPLNVRLDLGRKKLSLAPRASRTAGMKSEADAYNMVPVTVSIQNDTKWFTLHTTRWAWNARYRQVAFVWMDPSKQRPEITSIRNVRPVSLPKD